MSDSIPQDLIDKMMVKCARRCCICRRFRPTKLQVHHIVERSQGGSNDEGNLIVTCMSCHTDVHSKVPFARRFSAEELKGHRDALVRMVEQGLLPTDDTDDAAEIMHSWRSSEPTAVTQLSPEAMEILLRSVNTSGEEQGSIMVSLETEGLSIQMGDTTRTFSHEDRRTQAKYRRALQELSSLGFLDGYCEDFLDVTYAGYLAADEIMVSRGCAPQLEGK
jgi:hypothetical protein